MNKIWADTLHEFICQPMTRAYNAGLDKDDSILNEVDKLENKLLKLIYADQERVRKETIEKMKQVS